MISCKRRTIIEITNESCQDSVLTYLTLGADTNFITNVNGVFGIKDSGLQGSFWMHKDSVYTYEYDSKGISGNITFDTVPLNCPAGTFTTGTNLFELTINNDGTVKDAQESIDISNVSGCNSLGKFSMSGGGSWVSGGNDITSFYNSKLYDNYNKSGVFPFKCTQCTSVSGYQPCLDSLKSPKPQPHHICNVSRDAKLSGGKVRLTFLGFTE